MNYVYILFFQRIVTDGEDLALGEEEDGGENSTKYVGNGQGDPDTVEAVPADFHVKQWNEQAHRDEEDDLTGKAGNNGHPRFVNGLEEVGVDNGKTDEREHHHAITQGDAAQLNEVRVGGEGAHHGGGYETGYHTAY